MMTSIPYLVVYLAIAVCVIAIVVRFRMWARMPMHLRWELYPVAHEGKRAKWGGSYLEESHWWTKPRHTSLLAEVLAMAEEIFLLKGVWESNRKLWVRSFPFHTGLYLLIGGAGLMVVHGIVSAAAASLLEGGLGTGLQLLIKILLWAGLALGAVGALGLLQRRLVDPDLRALTAGVDFFNLTLFVVVLGFALVSLLVVDRQLAVTMAFVDNLVIGKLVAPAAAGPALILPVLAVVLLGLLLAYIPLTHMSHFVAKYFAYHSIRWDDRPNLRGGADEATINRLLEHPVSWPAPHIRGDGKKTWADLATEDMTK